MHGVVRPEPEGAGSLDELVERLRRLRTWAGASYRSVHREVVRARTRSGVAELPVLNTVYRCFQPGRARVDLELFTDVARALTGDDGVAQRWRQAWRVITGEATAAGIVEVVGDLPADLPADVPHLVGRDRELRRVVGATAPVVAISGMPGVGKTALAVRAAHLLAAGSDVRLAVDLRGHDPDRPPADPTAVLGAFLRRLGLTPDRYAHLDLAGRVARYRELAARRRVLVLLDNAAHARQVEPLLPGSGRTLVTSRRVLTGLAARQVRLSVLPDADAAALLRQAGGECVAGDPGAVAEITALLGGLPLALVVVAARIRAHPDWSPRDHLDRLVRHRDLLRLDAGTELAVRLSFDELPAGLRATLELLSLHPGEDFDRYAAAALTGAPLPAVTADLAELSAAHLLEVPRPGRYRFHDLIRTYSRAQALEDQPASTRDAALDRLRRCYERAASLAMDHYSPAETAHRPPAPAPVSPTPRFAGEEPATAWLTTERQNLLLTAVHGPVAHACHQSATLWRFLHQAGHYQEAEILHTTALRGADADRARALRHLCNVHWRLGRFQEALECGRQSVSLCRALGDRAAESEALTGLGLVHWQLGDLAAAVDHHERALDLAEAAGDDVAESAAATNLGLAYWRSGHFRPAVTQYRRALAIAERTGNEIREAQALGNLGIVYWQLGRHAPAMACEERAYAIALRTGHRAGQSLALDNLGLMHLHSARYAEAADLLSRALTIAREIGNRTLEASALGDLATAHRHLDAHAEALAEYRAALAIARETGDRPREAEMHTSLGDTLRALRRPVAALLAHGRALRVATAVGDPAELARAHESTGRTAHELGAHTRARTHWREALTLYTGLGVPEAGRLEALLATVPRPGDESSAAS
jgi:tetratricopeptide (TPR) repeat protein